MSDFLLYGANGYTGKLIAREALRQGLKPMLAGRNREALDAMAQELGLERRVFGLDDPKELARHVADFPLVLHCAGPFCRPDAGVAQLVRASACHAEGRGFEPRHSRHQVQTASSHDRGDPVTATAVRYAALAGAPSGPTGQCGGGPPGPRHPP